MRELNSAEIAVVAGGSAVQDPNNPWWQLDKAEPKGPTTGGGITPEMCMAEVGSVATTVGTILGGMAGAGASVYGCAPSVLGGPGVAAACTTGVIGTAGVVGGQLADGFASGVCSGVTQSLTGPGTQHQSFMDQMNAGTWPMNNTL